MRTESINIFSFDELEPKAKEKARQWYREVGVSDDWYSCVYDDAKNIGALMGVTIDAIGFTGFSSQGDGAHFEGTFGYTQGCGTAVIAHAPLDQELHAIARDWQLLQESNGFEVHGTVSHRGHYQHQYCTEFEVFQKDEDVFEIVEAEVKEILRRFMAWIYRQLEQQFEFENSDSTVDSNITGNGYEFTVNGSIYP